MLIVYTGQISHQNRGESTKKNGGDISMVHVDTNTIIGTRIIVILRERTSHKAFIRKKEFAIGILFSQVTP